MPKDPLDFGRITAFFKVIFCRSKECKKFLVELAVTRFISLGSPIRTLSSTVRKLDDRDPFFLGDSLLMGHQN
jgi:hypothetical protein